MSGHCNFCQVWHSGPCCHPGREYLESVKADLARVTAEREGKEAEVRDRESRWLTAMRERDALAAKLARCEGLLRVAHLHVNDSAPWEAIRDYFAASKQEPRT